MGNKNVSPIIYFLYFLFIVLTPIIARNNPYLLLVIGLIAAVFFWFLMWKAKLFSKAFGRPSFIFSSFEKMSPLRKFQLILIAVVILSLSLYLGVVISEIFLPSIILF